MRLLSSAILLSSVLSACTPTPSALPDQLQLVEARSFERLDSPPNSIARVATPADDTWVGAPVAAVSNPKGSRTHFFRPPLAATQRTWEALFKSQREQLRPGLPSDYWRHQNHTGVRNRTWTSS